MPPAHGGRARRPAAVRTTARRAAGPEVADRRSRCVPPPYPPLHLGMDGMGRQFSPIMMGDSLRCTGGWPSASPPVQPPRDSHEICVPRPHESRVLSVAVISAARRSPKERSSLAPTHPLGSARCHTCVHGRCSRLPLSCQGDIMSSSAHPQSPASESGCGPRLHVFIRGLLPPPRFTRAFARACWVPSCYWQIRSEWSTRTGCWGVRTPTPSTCIHMYGLRCWGPTSALRKQSARPPSEP